MISEARALVERLLDPFREGDLAFIRTAGNGRFRQIRDQLGNIYVGDNRRLADRLATIGLDNDFRELERDWQKRTRKAYLRRPPDHRTGRDEVLRCVIARAIVCQKVSLATLERADGWDNELAANPLPGEFVIRADADANHVADAIQSSRRICAALGQVQNANEDYCHFLDLIYHLLGENAELYGTRMKADVYTFQLANAIDELLSSRSAATDGAAFLIRSLLEVTVRRTVFRSDLPGDRFLVPSPRLDIPSLVKACYAEGLEFGVDSEILQTMWDNLNLVVHLGFRLNTATLIHFYSTVRSLRPMVQGAKTDEEARRGGPQRAQRIIERLEREGLVKEYVQPGDERIAVDILWRY